MGKLFRVLPLSQPLAPQEEVAFRYFHCKMSLQEGFTQTSPLLEPPWHNPQHDNDRGRLEEANMNSTPASRFRKPRRKAQVNMNTTVRKGFQGFEGKKKLLMMRKGVRHVTSPVKGLCIVLRLTREPNAV